MDSLLAASLSLHQDTSALMPSGRHAPGSVLGALPTWPQPCEVRQWEVFISIPISPVRKLGLTGIELTAQGPTAKCQSQAGLYTAGGETRKTTSCARAVLRSECRSVRRRRSFPCLAPLPRALQRKPVSWFGHVEAELTGSGNVFTGSNAHTNMACPL